MNNIWLKPYWRVAFLSVTDITGGNGNALTARVFDAPHLNRVSVQWLVNMQEGSRQVRKYFAS